MKKCSNPNCLEISPKYSIDKSRKDGLQPYCKTCRKISNKQNYKNKREIKLKYHAELYLKYKDKISTRNKKWKASNKGKVNAQTAKRHASKLRATPPWLTKEQLQQIEEFYILCKDLQWLSDPTDPLTVDHIVPLQGKNICGLHVPWNLQILPRSLNSSKRNKIT